MRVGQALGLRHGDFVSRRREIRIVARPDNANGARAKLREAAVIPVSTPLVRLYSEYMHAEYGDLDCDYVFVNLFGGRIGQPLCYPTVHRLAARISARTGIAFTVHMLRHTHATELIRRGVPIEVVARLLTHRSSTTTSQTYIHLDAVDVREALTRAGVWELPLVGEIAAPEAVLIRPDGHVAWAGHLADGGLPDALATWFGAATVA